MNTPVDAPSVLLKPLVSWPEEIETGRKYLVTVDVEFDTESSSWPYDTEEYAIGCMVEGDPHLAVESVGDTTLVLHRFGGTYGPARFVTYAVGDSRPDRDTELRLTLVTSGGVPFRSVRLGVRVGGAPPPMPVPEIEVSLLKPALPQSPVSAAVATGAEATVPTVLVLTGTGTLRSALRNWTGMRVTLQRYGGSYTDVCEVPGIPWRIVVMRSTWLTPGVGSLAARTAGEIGASLVLSLVQGQGVVGRTDHGDVVVATEVVLEGSTAVGEPSARVWTAARTVLGSSAHYAPVTESEPWPESRAAAVVGGESAWCLRSAYAVSGVEQFTVCAVGEAAVDRAVETALSVLGALVPDSDPLALPPGPERLVGRGTELQKLLERLDPHRDVLFATLVHGMPGIGKTALALTAANTAVERGWFPGGAFLIPEGTDPTEAAQEMRSRLPSRRGGGPVLFVYDGVEAGQEFDLGNLPESRPYRLLITSRGRTADPTLRTVKLEPLSDEDSADLFHLARGEGLFPDPVADSRLVDLCGGVPLALCLTARRLAPLSALLDVQAEGGIFGALDELREVYDAEYRRLTPRQASALRLLTVPPAGDLGPEMTVRLFGESGETDLEALTDAGLVAQAGGRWSLPVLVRAYMDQVAGQSETARLERTRALADLWSFSAVRTRGAVRSLGLDVTQSAPEPHGDQDRSPALAWLDGERANLLALTAETPAFTTRVEELGFRVHLCAYLNWRRYFAECVQCSSVVLESTSTSRSAEIAHLWNLRGTAQRGLGQLEQAAESHLRAEAGFRAAGDEWGTSKTRDALGLVRAEQGQWEVARGLHHAAAGELALLGDRRGEIDAITNLGVASLRTSTDHAEAHRLLNRAVEDCLSRGDALGAARVSLSRAGALCEDGDAESAAALAAELVRDFAGLDDTHGQARAWEIQGLAYEELNRYDEARAAWAAAAETFVAARDPEGAHRARGWARGLSEREAAVPQVRVTVVPAVFRTASVHWTVDLVRSAGVERRSDSGGAVRIEALHAELGSLSDALRLADSPVHPAPVEFALPLKCFDLAPHEWRDSAAERPERLGEQRPVTIRDSARSGPPDAARLTVWRHLSEAPVLGVSHLPVGDAVRRPAIGRGRIPFVCGPVSDGPGRDTMSSLLEHGHGVVLWATDPHPVECGPECRGLREQVHTFLMGIDGLTRLPEELWRVRAGDRASPLARLSLLYDDPGSPLPAPRRRGI